MWFTVRMLTHQHAHHGLLPALMAPRIVKQLFLTNECSHGLQKTLGRQGERKKPLALMEGLLHASHFALFLVLRD